VLVLVAIGLPIGGVYAQQQFDEPAVRQAIETVIELETQRDAPRLPRVSMDPAAGDLTVVFAMRRPFADDPQQIVSSATDDVFNILWASYTSPTASRIRTVTVLGTYSVVGRFARPREVPLLRAVMSARSAARMDWSQAANVNPAYVLDAWWVYGELTAARQLP
jgi:hypothetical protein